MEYIARWRVAGEMVIYASDTVVAMVSVFVNIYWAMQLGESNSCFPWAYGAQCFFAVGRFGKSLLLFLFELAAGCMFVLKLSEQIENQLIGLKTS